MSKVCFGAKFAKIIIIITIVEQVIIIGSGIIGLATALKLKEYNPQIKLLVLEKEKEIARHQTGNNSGVIHSGLYYKPGSLKAQNCIKGYNMLTAFCDKQDIPYDICGKIVVATEKDQLPALDVLYNRGTENGLKGLKKLNKEQLKEIEPHVNGIEGIHVPQAGIVDYSVVSKKYKSLIEDGGAKFIFNCKVNDIQSFKGHHIVKTSQGDFETTLVINCAGLYSDKVAMMVEKKLNIRILPFRGEYFKLKKDKEYLVNNLIYPVPNPNFPFLGVHFTRMMKGGVEAGPNAVLSYAREGYKKTDINLSEFIETITWPGLLKVAAKYWKVGLGELHRSYSKAAFTRALRELIPEIQADDLETGGAGVRAQACDRNGGLIDDFIIYEQAGIINVCNAPSPAATSSLSIGETIATMAKEQLNQ